MIVVADTAPLNYLVLIGQPAILPELYGRVIIPEAVALEQAAERGLLDSSKALDRLQKTNFRLSPTVLEFFRARNPKRKS